MFVDKDGCRCFDETTAPCPIHPVNCIGNTPEQQKDFDMLAEWHDESMFDAPVRTRTEILLEIERLARVAQDYGTEKESQDTCVAAGASDALRWVLGLSDPVSQSFEY